MYLNVVSSMCNLNFQCDVLWMYHPPHTIKLIPESDIHSKTLIEFAMVLSTNRRSFPSNSNVPNFFDFVQICGILASDKLWEIQCQNSMLTGRWWEGRILINLCGKNNVRNCDLFQSDFFARCSTVWGVAKGFFWHVVKLGKRWGQKRKYTSHDPAVNSWVSCSRHILKNM